MTDVSSYQPHPHPPTVAAVRHARRRRRAARLHRLLPGLVTGALAAVGGYGLTGSTAPTVLLALVGAGLGRAGSALLRRRLVAVTVRGTSMLPAYVDGDRVLVRRGTRLTVGRVVVVERPVHGWRLPPLAANASAADIANRHWMIKRVAAVPGDPLPDGLPRPSGEDRSARVPPGRLVLLGDNPDASVDSRQLGAFPVVRVLGTVWTKGRR